MSVIRTSLPVGAPIAGGSPSAIRQSAGNFSQARAMLAGYMTPPILVPLTAAAAIAAYGFYLRLW